MTSNVLPLFWNLASSSRDTRLSASLDLVSSLEGFQSTFQSTRAAQNGTSSNSGSDSEDDEEDEESGMEVDDDDDDDEEGDGDVDELEKKDFEDEQAVKLDKKLARNNAEDVVYCLKRLVRGLGSSRESSRLGFAVALTELLSRIKTITTPQVLSLISRNSRFPVGLKGAEARDLLFARLFGLTALINSGKLFTPDSEVGEFNSVIDQLLEMGDVKGWLRESAWWGIVGVVRGLLSSGVEWKDEGLEVVMKRCFAEEKVWGPEKVALVLVLERERPNLDWKTMLAPTFKHTPLLSAGNLPALGRILKESDAPDDDDEGNASGSTGSWKPQLHFVWNIIIQDYFPTSGSPESASSRAPFQDFFRIVVDDSLFSNTSSSERKYWGFTFISQILPLLPSKSTPQIFTPNFMRCWTNSLSSPDRYLHKAAMGVAKLVQEVVKANPTTGFALLSTLVGKNGKMDFDKATKTKTVEGIISGLSEEGVEEYVQYLQGIVLANEGQEGVDTATLDERRVWALDQLLGLCRNTSVPKKDAWISSTLDFLLVHGFFIIRKVNKKSSISALHSIPKPALSELAAAACRARFFSSLIELTTATSSREADAPARHLGRDSNGKLWLHRALETLKALEGDAKHVELVTEADEEIVNARKSASSTLASLSKVAQDQNELAKGVEILLSFAILQTYDENEEALEMLEDVSTSAEKIFTLSSGKASTSNGTAKTSEEDAPPVDSLLDVLIALLDRASSDLRSLATLVFGMIAPAFTSSSIQHLVAQLEQSAASAAAAQESDDEADDDEGNDDEDEDEDDAKSEEESSEASEDDDNDEDDNDEVVDPAFRQRVAEALQVSGMALNGKDDEDVDSDGESEVWDDERMMQVDEQLAEVFRQQASTNKRSDLKHLQIESLHFRNRILDFFDIFARRQSSNPLILDLILPLLRLVRSSGPSEGDLATKATVILRTRIGKAKDSPSPSSAPNAKTTLQAIHDMAIKSPTADFSAICSACSLFVTRACEDEHVVSVYKGTLENYMTKKNSMVHPPFITELLRRFPVRAWGLYADLVRYISPTSQVINAYRLLQAYTFIQILGQQLPVIIKSVGQQPVVEFTKSVGTEIYATIEMASSSAQGVEEKWTAPRLKEVVKVAMSLVRTSKNALGFELAQDAWNVARLEEVVSKFKEGERSGKMVGVVALLVQLTAVLKQIKEGKGTKQGRKEPVDGNAEAKDGVKAKKTKRDTSEKAKSDKPKAEKEKPVASDGDSSAKKEKKRKSIDGTQVNGTKAEGEKAKKVKKVKPSV